MGELKPAMRQFLVPLYAMIHNELAAKGGSSIQNPHPPKGPPEINAVRVRRRKPNGEKAICLAAAGRRRQPREEAWI